MPLPPIAAKSLGPALRYRLVWLLACSAGQRDRFDKACAQLGIAGPPNMASPDAKWNWLVEQAWTRNLDLSALIAEQLPAVMDRATLERHLLSATIGATPRDASTTTDRTTRLRNVLVALYSDVGAVEIFVADAGLSIVEIDFAGPVERIMSRVIDVAIKRGRLADLVKVARDAYPTRSDLTEAARAFGLE